MKSIQWRLVLLFIAVLLALIFIIGTFIIQSVKGFYLEKFTNQMENVFSDEFRTVLEMSAADMPEAADKIYEIIKVYDGRLGVDYIDRNYYILDGRIGSVLKTSVSEGGQFENLEKTGNVIAAMGGKVGKAVKISEDYMDFAFPISEGSEVLFIVYVKDNKQSFNDLISEIMDIILRSLVLGLLISGILGFLLSRQITTPILNLTKQSEKIAAGDFDYRLEVFSNDEIGRLTKTFNDMAFKLENTLKDIESEKHKVETILEHMTDSVIAFDTDGGVIHINPAAYDMLDVSEDIIFNEYFKKFDISIEKLIYIDNFNRLERDINIGNRQFKVRFAVFKKDNYESNGGVVVVFQDITEQHRLEEARREFVANVSHELRTPITTIKSYTETLIDGAIEDIETANYFLGIINTESDRMTRLVGDLLVLSKLDHKTDLSKRNKLVINSLIRSVAAKFEIEAKSRGLEFRLSCNDTFDIYADKDKIEQVLINIMGNAMKYTEDGGSISIQTGNLSKSVYIKIKDTGIGIPKEDLPRIFERFFRVDRARTREYGGTGLGLSISKDIIEEHNGTISIHSEIQEGTEVIITLPLNRGNHSS